MSWLLYGLQKNHRRQVVPVTYFLVWHMDSCVDTRCILVWWNPGKVFWMIDLKILFMLSNICMVQKPRIISNGLLKWFGSDNTNMNITATHAKITAVCFSDILFRLTTRQTSKLHTTGPLMTAPSPSLVASWFPAKRASNAENISLSWHHHLFIRKVTSILS